MSSTSKTMLRDPLPREQVVRRGSRVKPLNPHWVSWTGPTTQTDASTWKTWPSSRRYARLGRAHVASRRAGSAIRGRRRGPASAATSSGSWSGGVAMSASAKTIRSEVGGQHPAADGRALAAVRHRQEPQPGRHVVRDLRLGPRAHEGGRRVGAAVVDDEDLDPLGEAGRPGRPVARALATAPQVAEQLVERRADARLPRRRPAGRWSGWRAGTSAEVYGTGRGRMVLLGCAGHWSTREAGGWRLRRGRPRAAAWR